MNEKTKLQIRIPKSVKERFNLLCDLENKSQAEVFEELLNAYQTKVQDVKNTLEKMYYQQEEITEYVALLVKSSKELPSTKEAMEKYVSTDSRFKPLIKEKIHGKKKDISN